VATKSFKPSTFNKAEPEASIVAPVVITSSTNKTVLFFI